MRFLVVGTGGVALAFAAIAQRRAFFDHVTLADLDPARAQAVVDALGEPDRFSAARVDASSEAGALTLLREPVPTSSSTRPIPASTRRSSTRASRRG